MSCYTNCYYDQFMTQRQLDIEVFRLARDYLLGFREQGVSRRILKQYLSPTSLRPMPNHMSGVYQRLLESAQSSNMKPSVIGKAIGGVDKLSLVLHDFNPSTVIKAYGEDSTRLLKDIESKLKPRGQIRKEPQSIWPKYCKTILSSAVFLSQFKSAKEFYQWVSFFTQDPRSLPSLPMAISMEVSGIGFPLACDFLKELGYEKFAKPDVHLKFIFKSLHLCPQNPGDYQVFKAIVRVAEHAKVTPYAADKLFWLIGSGKFYDNPEIGNIGRHREEFVTLAKRALKKKGVSI